jgi:hypothetical protein
MGGDTFVPEIAGEDVEREHGDALREAWTEEFDQLIGEIQPFEATARCSRRSRDAASAWCSPARQDQARRGVPRAVRRPRPRRRLDDLRRRREEQAEPDIVRPRSRRSRARAA